MNTLNFNKQSSTYSGIVGPFNPTANTAPTSAAGSGNGGESTTEPNTAVERTQSLTSFIDNQATIADQRPASRPNPSFAALRQRETDGNDIKSVAARPTFIFNIPWSAADGAGTLLAYRDLPIGVLSASPIKLEKMQRYQFFSGDIVIRVIASAMAFQAGRLWLSFEAARNQRGVRACGTNIQAITSLDGIEFDPTVPTPLEFRVKYFAPMSEWDRIGQFGLGTVLFSVLSPLNSASTASTLTLSMQSWFENVTFGVPTQDPFIFSPVPKHIPMRRAYRQSGERKQAESSHVVSDTLDTVAEVANVVGRFPLLSSIAQPVSWASSAAASAARMFGFSKPDAANAPARMEIFPASTAHLMDGASDAVPLAATSNYEIPSGPVFGTEYDEMDISYICSRMPLVGSYGWDTSASVGTPVAYFPVMPGLCFPQTTSGSVSYGVYAPTPMAFVSTMFKYWAGALKFRLEAVSTQFHAGRLLVAYVPDFDPFGTLDITEIGNNYSIIWDVTTSTHIEFEVPYMSNVPYLETFIDGLDFPYIRNGESSGTQVRDRLRKVSNGAIVIFVLNQLVAPSTAANNISLLIWMGGGKDITFMEPTLGEYVVSNARNKLDFVGGYYDDAAMVQPSLAAPALASVDEVDDYDSFDKCMEALTLQPERVVRQSGTQFRAPDTGLDPNMTGSSQNDSNFETWMPMQYVDPIERAALVTGECITNLRVLTRRMSPRYNIFPPGVTTAGQVNSTPPTSNHVLCLDLDDFGTLSETGDGAIYGSHCGKVVVDGPQWITATPSFLSYISYLYTYVRGTRRYLVTSRPSSVINGSPFNTDGLITFADMTDPRSRSGMGEFDIRVSNVVSNEPYVRVPWFRPEETIYQYNNSNNGFSSIALNYTYGLGSLYCSDAYVKRIGTNGTSLEVSVSSGGNLPVRLLSDPGSSAQVFNAAVGTTIPRKRRFLEIRYRPHSTAQRGVTANYTAIHWPFPTQISEAAGDDLSFGYLQQPPIITRVGRSHIFVNDNGTLLKL
jgi:hypothetical protein